MNKRKGAVELKGERVAFLFFHLKRMEFFFFKGAHGVGFGHGVLLLIDGSCARVYSFFFCTQWLRAGIHSRPKFIHTNIYIHIRMHTYTYTHIYIYISIYLYV